MEDGLDIMEDDTIKILEDGLDIMEDGLDIMEDDTIKI